MEQVLKRFTLIDFAGIFAPGAVMTLAMNFYGPDLTAPFDRFFGENAVMLALYFLTVSYLMGSALHQLGAWLERWLRVDLEHEKYHAKPEIREAYRRCFHMEIPTDPVEAGTRILHYLQRDSRPERLILFNSFYTMSRTMVVTLVCLIPAALYYHRGFVLSWQTAIGLLAYIAVISLFRGRWIRFEKKFVEEAYLLFSFQKLEQDRTVDISREVRLTIRLDEEE